MIRSPISAIWLLAALLLGGCNKDDNPTPKPSGERTNEPEPQTPKNAPQGPFAGFDFAAALAQWQGVWTLPGPLGQTLVWKIDGNELVEFDGERERTYEFSLYSPCQVMFTDPVAAVTNYTTFVVVDGTLRIGHTAAGTVVDDAIIACIGGKIYVLRDDECREWTEIFDDWKSTPVECKVEGEGDDRRLVTPLDTIRFVSDTALASDAILGNVATKVEDYAAAKAALGNVDG
jgi:hypothetical protein